MTLVFRCSLLALFLFCAYHTAKAQQEVPWETLLEQMAEDEDYESSVLEDYYEELNELHTLKATLRNCPFLLGNSVKTLANTYIAMGEWPHWESWP